MRACNANVNPLKAANISENLVVRSSEAKQDTILFFTGNMFKRSPQCARPLYGARSTDWFNSPLACGRANSVVPRPLKSEQVCSEV